jgi:hypothetical protein
MYIYIYIYTYVRGAFIHAYTCILGSTYNMYEFLFVFTAYFLFVSNGRKKRKIEEKRQRWSQKKGRKEDV